jgi:prepilin-type N-terminal cleavage/methylation domain-containing protein
MLGKSKQGFSLLEIMVVILLLGIVATIVVPNLQQRVPGHKRKAFISELNTLLALGWQQAFVTQKIHRIYFDVVDRIVKLESEEPGPVEKEVVYKPVIQTYRTSSYEWPEEITIKNFYIDGIDELNQPERNTTSVWFYIMPEGLSQAVVINIEDTSQSQPIRLGLVLNPFTVQLKEYDTFQKP